MSKILITGSRGFIGTAIRKTIKHPYEEADLKVSKSHHHKNIKGEKGTLIHLSAWVQQNESMKSPAKYIENNLLDLATIIENNSFDRIIFPSTSCVYDRFGKLEPVSPYGVSKLAAEKLVRIYFKRHWILRFMNPYGENDKRTIFYLLAECMRKNETFKIFTSSHVVRDYFPVTHISKVINDILDGSLMCGTYNVGSGVRTDVAEFMTYICNKYGIKYEYVESPNGLLDGYIPSEMIACDPVDMEDEWVKYYL